MDLKKDLPKLGKETGRGVYYDVDGTSVNIGRRPIYADFKNNKYNDEESCVSVLIGISKPNVLLLKLVRRMESRSFNDRENDPSYGLYLQIKSLFQSIRKYIDIGIATKDIGNVPEIQVNDVQDTLKFFSSVMDSEHDVEFAYSSLNCEFSGNRYFNTLGFLNWMKENRFPIPDELAFNENDDGTFHFADSHKDHIIESDKPYTFPGKQITSWEDLKITLISYQVVEIKTQDEPIKLTFQQLGMANQQNPEKHKKVWETLMLFATLDGKYPNKDFPKASLENTKDRVKEFNKALNDFFNLTDTIYQNHYKKSKCWETKFTIQSRLEANRSQEDVRSLHQTEVEETQRRSNLSDQQLYQN